MWVKIEIYGFLGEIFPETLKWFALKLDSQNIEIVYVDSWGSGTAVVIISNGEIPNLVRINFIRLIQEQNHETVVRFVNSQPFLNLRLDPTSPQIPAYIS